MSTVLKPVGPHSPGVYWARRAVVLLLLIAVTLAVIFALRAVLPGGDSVSSPEPAATPDRTELASPGAQASAQPSTAAPTSSRSADPAVAACAADQIEIVATADKERYRPEATATLGMTITNTSDAPCAMDVGNGPLELRVTSGSDRIWSSDDCQVEATSDVRTIQPGEAGRMVSSVEWALTRSAPGCKGGAEQVRPGTYRLTARAGDLQSTPTGFVVS